MLVALASGGAAAGAADMHMDADVVRQASLPRGDWRSAKHYKVFGKGRAPIHFHQTTNTWLVNLVNSRAIRSRDLYEFGVYTGDRMADFARRMHGFGRMWGFDSFTGFPAEAADVWRPTDHWQKGGDSAADALNTHSTADLFAQLRRHIGYANLSFVEGYFNESLTAELARSRPFQPAVLIHLDCNMHTSTVQALDWLFQYKLAVPRTIVRYDDWPGNYTDETIRSYWRRKGRSPPPQVWGQMRSHVEATDRFKISWRRLNRNVFEVISVGRAAMSAIDPASSAKCPYPPCS